MEREIAGSREAALTRLARQPRPALAIVDRQLPDGDGLDVLRAARAVDTPVIMVTGYGSGATRRLALEEGAVGFLAKPFSAQDLLELVRGIVGDASGPATAPTNRAPFCDPRGPAYSTEASMSAIEISPAHRAMTRPGLGPFFDAAAVAVIGASADPSKVGGSVLANLKAAGFSGRLVVVNAVRPVVQGLPAVASILDVDDPIDLAVLAVPASAVLPTLKQCVAKGVPAAVVISAGFREAGDEGRAREAELRAWLREAPLRPDRSQLPWLDPPGAPAQPDVRDQDAAGRAARFLLALRRARHGDPRLVARAPPWLLARRKPWQPGRRRRNRPPRALADDPETRVILGYLEGVADGRGFFAALAAAAARKPCVLMKAGARPRAPAPSPRTPARWPAPIARSTPPSARRAHCA